MNVKNCQLVPPMYFNMDNLNMKLRKSPVNIFVSPSKWEL